MSNNEPGIVLSAPYILTPWSSRQSSEENIMINSIFIKETKAQSHRVIHLIRWWKRDAYTDNLDLEPVFLGTHRKAGKFYTLCPSLK